MVIYDLSCDLGHSFEGWFKNNEDMQVQKEQGLLTCPYCDSSNVTKQVTAAKVARKTNTKAGAANDSEPSVVTADGAVSNKSVAVGDSSAQQFSELQKMLGKVHEHIDANFQNVGNRFAEEAISMHRGEKEKENIKGTVNREQLDELKKEGVEALPLPPKPIDKKKLI